MMVASVIKSGPVDSVIIQIAGESSSQPPMVASVIKSGPVDSVIIQIAEESSSQPPSSSQNKTLDEALMKLRSFKQFDTADDHSDHHYANKGHSLKQVPKIWAKKIQEEWKILEKDLPDAIFVRVYESRMDLLRAVIKGADGTPYHDGLFFFDVYFPSDYPNVPPHVYYHAGGLRINPNLYASGYVCLSLLNTWNGSSNEKWIPGKSTMLQVLVSIQGLILNSKPYFNEPGYAKLRGTPNWETRSPKYNESTFILSLRTMSFTMRKPPKHFEELVVGHFCERARDILEACEAYIDGAKVGCLVKGRVQDLNAGDKSGSNAFIENVALYIGVLVTDLMSIGAIGATDCGKFLAHAETKKLTIAKTKSKLTIFKECAVLFIICFCIVFFLTWIFT